MGTMTHKSRLIPASRENQTVRSHDATHPWIEYGTLAAATTIGVVGALLLGNFWNIFS